MALSVLTVLGSRRPDAKLRRLADHVERALVAAHAAPTRLDLSETDLPVMRWGDETQGNDPVIAYVREQARSADVLVLATPEYHGSLSGALTHWFDFLYPELAGKLCGVLVTVGGAGGTGDMSAPAVRNSASWCHAFTLPYHVTASERDFTVGELTSERVVDRLERLGFDLVRYGAPLRAAYAAASEHAQAAKQADAPTWRRTGMAGWHT